MKKLASVFLALTLSTVIPAQDRWSLSGEGNGIVMVPDGSEVSDHIEMSGQRHLSAESGLYCRAIIEGMFGLRPTGLRSFDLTPRLADGWDRMSLEHVRAFGSDFDIEVVRCGRKVKVTALDNASRKSKTWKSREGEKISIVI